MHPVDRLIREATLFPRHLSEIEIGRIREHVARQPIDSRVAYVKQEIRRLPGEWKGQTISRIRALPLVEIHVIERVMIDLQWPEGTSNEKYTLDLQDAVRRAEGIYTYGFRGQAYVGFLATTTVRALGAEPLTWVAYSASFGVIRTGYQVKSVGEVFRSGFPPNWLPQR